MASIGYPYPICENDSIIESKKKPPARFSISLDNRELVLEQLQHLHDFYLNLNSIFYMHISSKLCNLILFVENIKDINNNIKDRFILF